MVNLGNGVEDLGQTPIFPPEEVTPYTYMPAGPDADWMPLVNQIPAHDLATKSPEELAAPIVARRLAPVSIGLGEPGRPQSQIDDARGTVTVMYPVPFTCDPSVLKTPQGTVQYHLRADIQGGNLLLRFRAQKHNSQWQSQVGQTFTFAYESLQKAAEQREEQAQQKRDQALERVSGIIRERQQRERDQQAIDDQLYAQLQQDIKGSSGTGNGAGS